MALGRKIINWDSRTMVKGASTSDRYPDGAFSATTDQVNLTATVGVLSIPEAPTDKSTNVAGSMIASCEDQTGNYTRLWVSTDTDQDGQFYSMDGTGAITTRGSEDTSHNYISGRTDFIGYQSEAYATTDTTIVRWSGIGSTNTFNTAFYSFSDSFAPHPAIVFEDNAFYGDGNKLLRQTSAGGTPSVILTLPTGQIIVALGIDPGSGKLLISIVMQYNVSDTLNSQARVSFYDGFSNKVLRTVLMDDMVTAFPHTEGQLYVAYGKNLGYWNGSGATFLRRMNVNYDSEQLLYKHRFTSIGPTLYFVQKHVSNSSFPGQIWAHGPIEQGGAKVFYPVLQNYENSSVPTALAYIGSLTSTTTGAYLGYGFATAKFFIFNVNGTASGGTQSLMSNVYPLDNENDAAWIRRVVIVWNSAIGSNVSPGDLVLYDENGAIAIGNGGLIIIRNTTGADTYVTEIPIGGGTGCRVRELRWQLILFNVNPGVRRVLVYGDPANLP